MSSTDSSSDDSDVNDVLKAKTDDHELHVALPHEFMPDASSSEGDVIASDDEVMENDRMANTDW